MKQNNEQLEVARVTEDSAPDGSNILSVIERAAKDPTVDISKMERLLDMHQKIVSRQSEQMFNISMSEAQKEMPRVRRDATNPTTRSLYARLETLNDAVIPVYTKYGFSLSFGTADCPIPDFIRIVCLVSHKAGHSRTYQCDIPNDQLGMKGLPSKTKLHGVGSAYSYGRRYLTLMIFNITLTNEDDDGRGAGKLKPEGPSTLAPEHEDARALVKELWNLLAEHRGTEPNWNKANEYLFELNLLKDDEPAVQRLPAKRIAEIIHELKEGA